MRARSAMGPGFDRGLFFAKVGLRPAALAGIVAFWLTAAFLHRGFSPFDDGAYAWAMEELFAGKRLHSDLAWGHPGYVLWILLPFQDFLSADILHYRYFLPPLAAVTAVSCVLIADIRSNLNGALVGLAVAALGYTQFATYSASWFGVCLTTACLACAHLSRRRQASSMMLAAGVLAGIAFGFRGTNGVAAAAGALVIISLGGKARRDARTSYHVLVVALFVAVSLGIAALANTVERALFAFPAATCFILAARYTWKYNPPIAAPFWRLTAGFSIGVAPLLLTTLAQQSTVAMIRNIVLIPGSIAASLSDYRVNGMQDMISQGLEIATSSPNLLTIGNVVVFLLTALSPIYVTASLVSAAKPSPVSVLAAIACIGMISLPNIIYAPYLWPFVALLALTEPRANGARQLIVAAVCIMAITITPRGYVPGSFAWFTDPEGLGTERCPVRRCSVVGEERSIRMFGEDVAILNRVVPISEALIVFPSTASFAYFLPHSTPFTLGRTDATGSVLETTDFRRDFLTEKNIVVAIPEESLGKYDSVLVDLCRYRQEGRWIFLRTCS